MRASVKLKPGQRGTKRYREQYGEQLFCVRYRYDQTKRKRYTTVELIVAESSWIPPTPPDMLVGVRIALDEVALQRQIRAASGQWNRQRQLWEITFGQVQRLNLLHRLVWLDP